MSELRTAPDLEAALINCAVESWRFSRLFLRVISKLDAGEARRYEGQVRYLIKGTEDQLLGVGLRMVSLEGHTYEPGMAVTALNMEEFAVDDSLVVEQMIEPIIMSETGLKRTGVVMLRRLAT